jgi:hypothetical protein
MGKRFYDLKRARLELLESKAEDGSGSAEEIQELQHIHECAATKREADRALHAEQYAERTIGQVLCTMSVLLGRCCAR